MLVLSRKESQSILVGDGPNQVRIDIIRIARGKVRVGITAAAETRVLREELTRNNEGESHDEDR